MFWKRVLLSWMTLLAVAFVSAGATAAADVSPKTHVGAIDLAAAICIEAQGLASAEEHLGNPRLSTAGTSDVPDAARAATPLAKNSVIEGFKVSNHAWRKSGLGRGATEELVSGVIQGARKAGTVVQEVGTGKFAGNTIEVFVHNGVKVAVDSTRKIIMSIRPVANNTFKLP